MKLKFPLWINTFKKIKFNTMDRCNQKKNWNSFPWDVMCFFVKKKLANKYVDIIIFRILYTCCTLVYTLLYCTVLHSAQRQLSYNWKVRIRSILFYTKNLQHHDQCHPGALLVCYLTITITGVFQRATCAGVGGFFYPPLFILKAASEHKYS